jgi:hypothetical protein
MSCQLYVHDPELVQGDFIELRRFSGTDCLQLPLCNGLHPYDFASNRTSGTPGDKAVNSPREMDDPYGADITEMRKKTRVEEVPLYCSPLSQRDLELSILWLT